MTKEKSETHVPLNNQSRKIEGKCPHCLSIVTVDNHVQHFDCPYCGRHFEIERLEPI